MPYGTGLYCLYMCVCVWYCDGDGNKRTKEDYYILEFNNSYAYIINCILHSFSASGLVTSRP
jgi:hypothetical protein